MTDQTGASARTAFTRKPDRGSHDLAEARAILAEALIGHVGTVDASGDPVVLPVAMALDPDADRVLFHGSTGAGMFRRLAAGAPACLTVTHLDGLVIARSAFESSMNYRSVVVLGRCEVLDGDDKQAALRVITDHLTPGRWDAARPLRSSEVAATLVLALPLVEFSVKSRDGGPNDDDDAQWPIWAGHVPVRMVVGAPIPAPGSDAHPGAADPWLPAGTGPVTDLRAVSLWWDSLGEAPAPRARLDGDLDVDVAIVGAGYTGLWTAYYLAKAAPGTRIAIVEANVAGFGASGRNGGWCSALFPASLDKIARTSSRHAAIAMQHAMHDTVDEVGRVAVDEGLDIDWAKGGTVGLARTSVQLDRAREDVAHWRSWGFGAADYRLLDADDASARVGATSVLGATYTPHCAAIHPAKLARGLAGLVEAAGVRIYEGTPATSIEAGVVRTPFGDVRAPHVVRATEAFTATLAGPPTHPPAGLLAHAGHRAAAPRCLGPHRPG